MSGEANWLSDNLIALVSLVVGLTLSIYNARVAWLRYKDEKTRQEAADAEGELEERVESSATQLELTLKALQTQNSLLTEERLEYKKDIEKLEGALDRLRKAHQELLRRDAIRERREAILIATIERSLQVEVPVLPVLPELN